MLVGSCSVWNLSQLSGHVYHVSLSTAIWVLVFHFNIRMTGDGTKNEDHWKIKNPDSCILQTMEVESSMPVWWDLPQCTSYNIQKLAALSKLHFEIIVHPCKNTFSEKNPFKIAPFLQKSLYCSSLFYFFPLFFWRDSLDSTSFHPNDLQTPFSWDWLIFRSDWGVLSRVLQSVKAPLLESSHEKDCVRRFRKHVWRNLLFSKGWSKISLVSTFKGMTEGERDQRPLLEW